MAEMVWGHHVTGRSRAVKRNGVPWCLGFLVPWASLVAQRLKHLPATWETWVQSLGQKDPLEKELATHSSILAWRIPWTGEPGGIESTGWKRVGHDWETNTKHNIKLDKSEWYFSKRDVKNLAVKAISLKLELSTFRSLPLTSCDLQYFFLSYLILSLMVVVV